MTFPALSQNVSREKGQYKDSETEATKLNSAIIKLFLDLCFTYCAMFPVKKGLSLLKSD